MFQTLAKASEHLLNKTFWDYTEVNTTHVSISSIWDISVCRVFEQIKSFSLDHGKETFQHWDEYIIDISFVFYKKSVPILFNKSVREPELGQDRERMLYSPLLKLKSDV